MPISSFTLARSCKLLLILALLLPYPTVAGIQGSVHDFSQNGWSGGEICGVCHAPHNASGNSDAPLWNHATSTATYTLYSSPTLKVDPEQPNPGNVSRLCLSCHDGTIAIDSFGGNSGTITISNNANLGTDLSDDHPIGIRWVHQTQTSGSFDCLGCHKLQFDPGSQALVFGQPGEEIKFFNGKVECASCHDVHNSQVMDEKLLRLPRAGSQLCLHCHPM